MKYKKKMTTFQKYKMTLEGISKIGDGVSNLNYENCFKMSKARALEVLKDKCKSCGKTK